MRKALKIVLYVLTAFAVLIAGFFIYAFAITANAKLDINKLKNAEKCVRYYSCSDELMEESNGKNAVTSIDEISDDTVNAFIAIEDKRFYSHKGVDYKGLMRAIFNNIKSFSFKEGASTISQQLIKNTHLSQEKTFKRKLTEMKLAKELEKKFTKSQIMETYLNTIYFGDNCYGITEASRHYFDKEPENLSVSESAVLAGLIKAPSNYSPTKNYEKCLSRRNLVLKEMYNQGKISADKYDASLNENISVNEKETNKSYDYTYLVKKEVEKFAERTGNYYEKLNVYTYFDQQKQTSVENAFAEEQPSDYSAVMLGKNNKILAYYSTVGDIKRPLGSTIKPIGVYAPAIERNIICPLTPVLDEKTDFGGYSPSNYGESYDGYISAKDALIKSKNVCAVKILEGLGVDKAKGYLGKTGITLSENDNSLCLALGATENGEKLSNITAAYGVFNNDGYYVPPTTIRKITDTNGKVLYENREISQKVYQQATVFLMNDMLSSAVKEGTAKRLSFSNVETCAKTGTVGFENGNTDAYTISYNNDFTLGVWYGNKDNSLMANSVTGGTIPCDTAREIWNNVYDGNSVPYINQSDDVVKLDVDKDVYENEHVLVLANPIMPKRYVISGYFNKLFVPKSSSFFCSVPKVEKAETLVNYNSILIRLCLTKYADARIYKVINGKNYLIYDTFDNEKEYMDDSVLSGGEYEYVVVPYYKTQSSEIIGECYVLPKIKVPMDSAGGDWWKDAV